MINISDKEKTNEADKFKEFARKLVSVPKKEIDEQMKRELQKNDKRKSEKRK